MHLPVVHVCCSEGHSASLTSSDVWSGQSSLMLVRRQVTEMLQQVIQQQQQQAASAPVTDEVIDNTQTYQCRVDGPRGGSLGWGLLVRVSALYSLAVPVFFYIQRSGKDNRDCCTCRALTLLSVRRPNKTQLASQADAACIFNTVIRDSEKTHGCQGYIVPVYMLCVNMWLLLAHGVYPEDCHPTCQGAPLSSALYVPETADYDS